MWRAARQARDGDARGATQTLLDAWLHCVFTSGATCLVDTGAELCVTALRKRVAPNLPEGVPDGDVFYNMQLSTPEGCAVSFEDVAKDPAELAALRCVNAKLNNDGDLLSCVLDVYIGHHGAVRTLDILAELINYYLVFGQGHIDDEVFGCE
jgi:hypothetical protein